MATRVERACCGLYTNTLRYFLFGQFCSHSRQFANRPRLFRGSRALPETHEDFRTLAVSRKFEIQSFELVFKEMVQSWFVVNSCQQIKEVVRFTSNINETTLHKETQTYIFKNTNTSSWYEKIKLPYSPKKDKRRNMHYIIQSESLFHLCEG